MNNNNIVLLIIILLLLLIVILSVINYNSTNNNNNVNTPYPTIENQPNNTIFIVNETSEDLTIFMTYGNNPQNLMKWTMNQEYSSSGVTIGPPQNETVDSIGSKTGQYVTLPKNGDTILINIPTYLIPPPTNLNLVKPAFQIIPVKKVTFKNQDDPNGKDYVVGLALGGHPVTIECSVGSVCNMSAVEGANYLVDQKMTNNTTNKNAFTTINLISNPCTEASSEMLTYKLGGVNAGTMGCFNPSVDGIFQTGVYKPQGSSEQGYGCCADSTNFSTCKNPAVEGDNCSGSLPCRDATCHLVGKSLAWCEALHSGQCANSSTTLTNNWDTCDKNNKNTTYCYSHDDHFSSPPLLGNYKIQLIYTDLNGAYPREVFIPTCSAEEEKISQSGVGQYAGLKEVNGTYVGVNNSETPNGINFGATFICYHARGVPPPPPGPPICTNYTPDCTKDSYWCPNTQICSTTITKCTNECKSKGTDPTPPTYPNCTTPYPPCAIGSYACYHDVRTPDCATDPKIFIDNPYDCTSICHNVR